MKPNSEKYYRTIKTTFEEEDLRISNILQRTPILLRVKNK